MASPVRAGGSRGLWPARRVLLEGLYATLNRRALVYPDPVGFLYGYEDPLDREIVAFIASALAYGRVMSIRHSVGRVLACLPSPRGDILSTSDSCLAARMGGFRHRFTTEEELIHLLAGIRGVILRHGSLLNCVMGGLSPDDQTTLGALQHLVMELNPRGRRSSLLPPPSLGSACKRLHLCMRWLVRRDQVDPGGWEAVGAHRLMVPLDAHMFRMARRLGLTGRGSASAKAAADVTEAFRAISPDDPVRYDFALTRLAMGRGDVDAFLRQWQQRGRARGTASPR